MCVSCVCYRLESTWTCCVSHSTATTRIKVIVPEAPECSVCDGAVSVIASLQSGVYLFVRRKVSLHVSTVDLLKVHFELPEVEYGPAVCVSLRCSLLEGDIEESSIL